MPQAQKEALINAVERSDPRVQREELSNDIATAISNTVLKVINVDESTPTDE